MNPIKSLFDGKIVVITGGSQGIGKVLAEGFAEAGASVAILARNIDRLQSAADEISSKGGQTLAIPADITKAIDVSSAIETVKQEYGRIDILINCAGGAGTKPFVPLLDMEERIWDQVIALNLKGVFLCCREAGRVMREQGSGCIINISSGAGATPVPGETHYGAAKAGVNHLTKVLSVELGKFNIRVNAISPGLIATEATKANVNPEQFALFAKAIPLGRAGEPEDIVGLALFLASDEASYITGTVIPVGGGPQ